MYASRAVWMCSRYAILEFTPLQSILMIVGREGVGVSGHVGCVPSFGPADWWTES